jgi:hypothetical protein
MTRIPFSSAFNCRFTHLDYRNERSADSQRARTRNRMFQRTSGACCTEDIGDYVIVRVRDQFRLKAIRPRADCKERGL